MMKLIAGLATLCALAAWKRWSYKLDVTFSSGPFWHHLSIGWWRVRRVPSSAPKERPGRANGLWSSLSANQLSRRMLGLQKSSGESDTGSTDSGRS